MIRCRYCLGMVPHNCRNCPLCGLLMNTPNFNSLALRRAKRKYCELCYSNYMEHHHTHCWNCGKKHNFLSSHL